MPCPLNGIFETSVTAMVIVVHPNFSAVAELGETKRLTCAI